MRRVAAIVLPALACELVRQRSPEGRGLGPLGILLDPTGGAADAARDAPTVASAVLDLVDDEARRYGVRPGQRVSEASVLLPSLAVRRVTHGELDAALGRVAEVAMGLGPTAAVRLAEGAAEDAPRTSWGEAPFDTVWLDITGSAHLVGGEEALSGELLERAAALGHRARVAIAGGPRIAQALARWASGARPAGEPPRGGAPLGGGVEARAAAASARAMASLPVQALPLDVATASWFIRLGVITVGDLARLPRAGVRARLGARAAEVLELLAGRDEAPLVAYVPPRALAEEVRFEEGVAGAESLVFVLRAMASRLEARLTARGEACGRLEVTIPLDRSIAALRGVTAPEVTFAVDLPAPLAHAADLLRALKARLDRVELPAPAVGIRLTAPQITSARKVQLDLSRHRGTDPDRLPALLAELSAEIGPARVGTLSILDALRPEARSGLRPIDARTLAGTPGPRAAPGGALDAPLAEPTRLLARPVPLGPVLRGATVAVEQTLFEVGDVRFVMRLDGVEWWTHEATSRDYARVWLVSGAGQRPRAWIGPGAARPAGAVGEGFVYFDPSSDRAFLQGWYE